MIDPSIEEAVRDAIQTTATGSYLAMPPDMAKDIVTRIQSSCEPAKGLAKLLTQADVRRFVRRLIEVEMPDTAVLSYQELAPDVSVEPVGRIAM
jgi:type III secretion protein V